MMFLLLLCLLALGAYVVCDVRAQRNFWQERCTTLEKILHTEIADRFADQRAATEREQTLFDQALKRHGAQPLNTPPVETKATPQLTPNPTVDPHVYGTLREAWIADEVEAERENSFLTGAALEAHLQQVTHSAGIAFDKRHNS